MSSIPSWDNLRDLTERMAGYYHNASVRPWLTKEYELADLIQIGYVVYSGCKERFCIERGVSFRTYYCTALKNRYVSLSRDTRAAFHLHVGMHEASRGVVNFSARADRQRAFEVRHSAERLLCATTTGPSIRVLLNWMIDVLDGRPPATVDFSALNRQIAEAPSPNVAARVRYRRQRLQYGVDDKGRSVTSRDLRRLFPGLSKAGVEQHFRRVRAAFGKSA